ncbi:nucleolar protein 12, partial [Tremellales sp. Uapishka_1]
MSQATDAGSADRVPKRKREKGEEKEQAEKHESVTNGGLKLFTAAKDADLDDMFSKGAVYALPSAAKAVAPVASTSKTVPSVDAMTAEETPKPAKKAKKAKVPTPVPVAIQQKEQEEEEGEEEPSDESDEDLVHESVKAAKAKKVKVKASNQKYTPADETDADRDRRTIFIGNLPIECAKSKVSWIIVWAKISEIQADFALPPPQSALNQLKTHILSFVPSAKIEAIRFRSVAFAQPTAEMPSEDPEKDEARRVKREKERAAAWRANQEDGDDKDKKKDKDEVVDQPKSYMDAKGKRKVAFIKKDFHSELESCNAYVVFAHPHPDRPSNVAPILDPYEAATKALAADATEFLERTIRVDKLRLPSAVALAQATNALGKRDAWLPSGTDPKKSLFVGGLDYAAKEEDVRVFFEELVKAERGSREERYVVSVRIIRDRETQLGKGFGYVHFADRESADEILALDSKKLKFAKKPLRVQQSKT